MKILVTGGAGFIGTNLIIKLLSKGHEVYSIDNYISGFKKNHQKGCAYIDADILQIDNQEFSSVNFDLIYHLAALSRIQPSFENPTETFTANTQGTIAVLNYARKINCKVIYAGSSSRWHNPLKSPYALFKHMGEELCELYRGVYGLDIHITRFYNVYGDYEIMFDDWAALIGKWRGLIKLGQPLTIVGDGEQRRDFTHVDCIVSALYKLSTFKSDENHVWELGTGKNYSINEIYNLFKDRFGSKVSKVMLPDQMGNYRETIRENDDSLNLLNWKPKDNIRNYIKNL
jgi:UDP-glucose 4-epimerase